VIFIASAWVTKYASVGSVLASIALVPTTYVVDGSRPVVAAAAAAAAVIVFQHRTNLARVLTGTERRLGARI
jgi:glycerol-3-phosphate acyltransferase PlsY